MTSTHDVFFECAERCTDPHMADVFFGLAYGLLPFCVSTETGPEILYFRRSFAPGEKDKAIRTAVAMEELAALPAVQWYHAGAANRAWSDTLQTTGSTALRVAWSIAQNDAEAHLRIVPALLAWTKWERDAPWATMRRRLATEAASIGPATITSQRHHRQAMALDFLGMRAVAEGRTNAQIVTLVRDAAEAMAAGKLEVTFGPDGDVVGVVNA